MQIATVASQLLAAGQVRVRVQNPHVGVNFHDIYVRSGLYKTLTLPDTPGIEAVGVVAEVGEGVSCFRVDDRVCYFSAAYAIYALVASSLLRGLTADVLLHRG